MRKINLIGLVSLFAHVFGGRNFYEILGISKKAKDADIKKAYRKLSREWHPDQNPDNKEEATQKFYDISEAYEVLTDPEKRSKYDMGGEEALNGGGAGGPGGHGFQRGDPYEQFRTFFQFFGGDMGGGGGFPGGGFPGGGFPGGGGHQFQQAAPNLYDEKSGVTEIGNVNEFNSQVNQRSDIVIVDFYSPTCQPCKQLKSEYITVAKTFSGIVRVLAVNCQNQQAAQICQSQGIKNYPTIRMYGDNNSKSDFPANQQKNSKTIGNWISNGIPDFTTKIASDKHWRSFLETAGSKAPVVLFSDKKQVPALFKSLCRQFKTNIACGVLSGYNPAVNSAFLPSSLTSQIDKTPSLYYIHDQVTLDGEKFKGSMGAEVLSLFFSRVISHKSRQVSVDQLTAGRGEDCSPVDSTTCVLLLRKPTDDTGNVTEEYTVMKKLAERYKSDPIKFFWVNPGSKFVSLFSQAGQSPIVAYRGKRGKYSFFEGETADFESVNSWIDNIISGGSSLPHSVARKARHDEL